jgi:hypothetical protein
LSPPILFDRVTACWRQLTNPRRNARDLLRANCDKRIKPVGPNHALPRVSGITQNDINRFFPAPHQSVKGVYALGRILPAEKFIDQIAIRHNLSKALLFLLRRLSIKKGFDKNSPCICRGDFYIVLNCRVNFSKATTKFFHAEENAPS